MNLLAVFIVSILVNHKYQLSQNKCRSTHQLGYSGGPPRILICQYRHWHSTNFGNNKILLLYKYINIYVYSNIKIKWKSYPKSWRISVTFCLMEWKCWSCSYYQYMYWETTPKIVPCCTHPYIWGSDLGHRRSSLPWPLPIKYSLDFWALSVEIHAHVNFISS